MKKLQPVLEASLVWQWLMTFSDWCATQWQQSAIVTAFLTPNDQLDTAICESSIFFRLFQWVRTLLSKLYHKLNLDRLFTGSIFTHPAIFAIIAVSLAAIIPTMAVLAVVLVTFCSVLLCLIRDGGRPLAHSPMNRYVLLYCALYLAATLFSVSPATSLSIGLISIAFTFFAVLLQNSITSRKALDFLIDGIIFFATLVALYGCYQYIFKTGYQSAAWVDSNMFSEISFRITSTLGNPNMLGQFFILVIPFAGANLLRAKNWTARGYYFGCCGILCVAMLLTFSRGAWLGLLIAGAVFVLLLNPKLLLLTPVALIALYFILPESIILRFTSIGNMSDASTSYRVYIWMGVIEMLKDYWICGIGPGDAAFNLIYPIYGYSAVVSPHAHNLFLQIVCDAGISALVIFCAILFQYFRTLCAAIRRRESWDSRLLQVAGCASIAGFMVQAMTDYSFYNYRVMFLFWAFLGLGMLAARREQLTEEVTL